MAASMAQGGSERVPAAAPVALVANARAERAELDARAARAEAVASEAVSHAVVPPRMLVTHEHSCDEI